MSTIDEILATGEYESRTHGLIQRCREACSGNGLWVCAGHFEPWEHLTTEQVAKAIERDQHRDECPSLVECDSHPVWSVAYARLTGGWNALAPYQDLYRDQGFTTHAEAMSAARALAVGE